MQTVKITTSQNIDIDYEIAGIGERILARLIDMGIFVLIYILAIILFLMEMVRFRSNTTLIVVIIVYAALFVFYDLLCEIFMNGQSVGKRIMKIKVISLDGKRPSFSQYLLRWSFRIVDFTLSLQLCALICAAVSEKQQRLGDVVAGTTLIKTRPPVLRNTIVFTPVADGYVPVFNNVTQLKDDDIALIQEVIRTYRQTANGQLVYNTSERIREVLGVEKPKGMDDYKFLQTVVSDYSHLSAQADV